MTITQQEEDAIQALADHLENIAECIRGRGFRGREKGTMADLQHELFELSGKFAGLIREVK